MAHIRLEPICAAGLVLLLLITAGCGGKRDNTVPVEHDIRTITIHAEFLFLPDKDRLLLDVYADSIIIQRRNPRDSTVLDMHLGQSAVTRAITDSLGSSLRRVHPGSFAEKGVLDGTRITIRWGNNVVICDNCLNDYIMQAAGNDFVIPPKRLKPLRDAVQSLSLLDRMAENTTPVNKLTTEVMVDTRRLTDSTTRYRVNKTK